MTEDEEKAVKALIDDVVTNTKPDAAIRMKSLAAKLQRGLSDVRADLAALGLAKALAAEPSYSTIPIGDEFVRFLEDRGIDNVGANATAKDVVMALSSQVTVDTTKIQEVARRALGGGGDLPRTKEREPQVPRTKEREPQVPPTEDKPQEPVEHPPSDPELEKLTAYLENELVQAEAEKSELEQGAESAERELGQLIQEVSDPNLSEEERQRKELELAETATKLSRLKAAEKEIRHLQVEIEALKEDKAKLVRSVEDGIAESEAEILRVTSEKEAAEAEIERLSSRMDAFLASAEAQNQETKDALLKQQVRERTASKRKSILLMAAQREIETLRKRLQKVVGQRLAEQKTQQKALTELRQQHAEFAKAQKELAEVQARLLEQKEDQAAKVGAAVEVVIKTTALARAKAKPRILALHEWLYSQGAPELLMKSHSCMERAFSPTVQQNVGQAILGDADPVKAQEKWNKITTEDLSFHALGCLFALDVELGNSQSGKLRGSEVIDNSVARKHLVKRCPMVQAELEKRLKVPPNPRCLTAQDRVPTMVLEMYKRDDFKEGLQARPRPAQPARKGGANIPPAELEFIQEQRNRNREQQSQ